MAQLYATTAQIMLLLDTRLEIAGAQVQAFGSNLGAQKIKPELIVQVQEGTEASINATLDLIYILPVVSAQALLILRDIVCEMVVADVIRVHFFATTNPQIGGDAGFGSIARNEGIKKLERYTAGFGVYYGGSSSSGAIPRTGNQIQQAIPLPGVPLKPTSDVHRPLQPFECYAVESDRSSPAAMINWGI